jgi:hypothetical protein
VCRRVEGIHRGARGGDGGAIPWPKVVASVRHQRQKKQRMVT